MVESLSQLRERCQKPRYKEVGNWMVRHILRDAALPLTWLLLHTSLTANQVTLIALLTGLGGLVCLAFPGTGMFLAGVLLLQFWYYLDHVDGQIARYRGTASLSGRYFDYLMHHLVHGLILFALGCFLFFQTGQFIFVLWGFAGTLGTLFFNLSHDIQHKTFFEQIMRSGGVQVRPEFADEKPKAASKSAAGLLKKIFQGMHKAHEMHVWMNGMTAAALLQIFLRGKPVDFRICFFVFYGLAAPALAIVKNIFLIRFRKVDAEFDKYFDVSSRG